MQSLVTLGRRAVGSLAYLWSWRCWKSPLLTRGLWVYSHQLGKDVSVITFMGLKG